MGILSVHASALSSTAVLQQCIWSFFWRWIYCSDIFYLIFVFENKILRPTVSDIGGGGESAPPRGWWAKNTPWQIGLIDFEKAFDSVSFSMIDATLEMFGFRQYYRDWITILLKDFEACVNNSGNISTRFPVARGCRQGAFISGYLFILCIEVVSIALKSNDSIKPYKLLNADKHLQDQYADDLTLYLEWSESHTQNANNVSVVLETLESFCLLSGLKVNRGKTMLTIFGNKDTDPTLCEELRIKWCTKFKLLGLWFDQTL